MHKKGVMMNFTLPNVQHDRAFDFLDGRTCMQLEKLSLHLVLDEKATGSSGNWYLVAQAVHGDLVHAHDLDDPASSEMIAHTSPYLGNVSKHDPHYVSFLALAFHRAWGSATLRFTLPNKKTLASMIGVKCFESQALLGSFLCPVVVRCGSYISSFVGKIPLDQLLLPEDIAQAVRLFKGNSLLFREFF